MSAKQPRMCPITGLEIPASGRGRPCTYHSTATNAQRRAYRAGIKALS